MRAWWSQLLLPHRLIHLRSRYDCSLLCFDEPTTKIESGPLCFFSSSILALISFSAWSQRDLLVLAADQLHRRLQPVVAVAVLAQRRALGAVRAEVERRIEHRLLADPDAVLDHRVDGAADRAVRADGAADDDRLRRRAGRASAASAFFTSVSCEVARPTPTPRPERRRNARRSIVGMARRTPRARLATSAEDATAAPPAPSGKRSFASTA